MNKSEIQNLIQSAIESREKAYVPYSNFAVGAALLTNGGKIYNGCNIENASYTPTNCAERTAVFKAVSEGEKEFVAIAVVGGHKDEGIRELIFPCGVCRQVLVEFCDPKKFKVFIAKNVDDYEEYLLEDILPKSFSPKNLEKSV